MKTGQFIDELLYGELPDYWICTKGFLHPMGQSGCKGHEKLNRRLENK